METMQLKAKPRTQTGSRNAKRIRRNGSIPAILYGHGMKPVTLEVGMRDFYSVIHTRAGENVLINLKVEGLKLEESTCLIKDIQHDPVTEAIDHIDFTVISMTEKIQVKVPLVVQNSQEAFGVKEGGVMDVVHHEIEVECLPTQIPEKIVVDVKEMKIGDSVYAKDLKIPPEVLCKMPAEEVVVALHPPAKEVAVEEEAAPVEPEVIEKGKKLEETEETAPPKAEKAAKPEKKE